MKKVLVTSTNYTQYSTQGTKLLEQNGIEVIDNPYNRPYTPEELKAAIGDIDGVIGGVDIWDEDIYACAAKLKVIARFGVGYDNIDLQAAKRFGIAVTNCPGVNASAVAEQAAALILALSRQVPYLFDSLKSGKWERVIFNELKGRTLGLLGFGAISRQVAKKLSGFEMSIIAYDKYPNEDAAEELSVKLAALDEVLAASDIISIHLPSLPETRHLINAQNIAKMKNGVLLVNTARGPLVSEAAVYNALVSGKIAGMASDVYEQEPADPKNPLFALPNFIGSPHVSSETYDNYEATGLMTARAVVDVLQGRTPANILNP